MFEFFGLIVGINLLGMLVLVKCEVYVVDIIYGMNNEYGFDYLCDNMVFSFEECV